jgi:hypothetical protein
LQAAGNRNATTTYYRVAIAAGKNMSFPFPSWENSTDYGFGTDGTDQAQLQIMPDVAGKVPTPKPRKLERAKSGH